jgi:hypothetical protein
MTHSDRSQKNYDESDVAQVLRKANPRNFNEMIRWLRQEGDNDRRLTSSEVAMMIEDASKVKARKKEFINDPGQLYREMKRG